MPGASKIAHVGEGLNVSPGSLTEIEVPGSLVGEGGTNEVPVPEGAPGAPAGSTQNLRDVGAQVGSGNRWVFGRGVERAVESGVDEYERKAAERAEEVRRKQDQQRQDLAAAEAATLRAADAEDARIAQEQAVKEHNRQVDAYETEAPQSVKMLDRIRGDLSLEKGRVGTNELEQAEELAPSAAPDKDVDIYGLRSQARPSRRREPNQVRPQRRQESEEDEDITPDPPSQGADPSSGKAVVQTKRKPARKFFKIKDAIEGHVKGILEQKRWTGRGFSEKVISNREVPPNAMRISEDIVRDIVREPKSNIVDIVNEASGEAFTTEEILFSATGMSRFAAAVNGSEVFVAGSKSPVAYAMSSQRRRLLIGGSGRGIEVHPTQTKVYNMDFDGDEARVQFVSGEGVFANAMEYLISPFTGRSMIDLDFFPIASISDDIRQYREFIDRAFFQDVGRDETATRLIRGIADALYNLSHPKGGVDADDAMVDVIRAMQALCDNYLGDRNRWMSYLLNDIYINMQMINNIEIGLMPLDSSNMDEDAENPYDRALTKVIEDIVFSDAVPANYQDFVNALGHYLGEVPGKNSEFRIGAGIAKRINASRVTFKGNEDMIKLFDLTLKSAQAMRMNSRIRMGENKVLVSQIVYNRIISEVGFPNDPRYADSGWFSGWLKAFKKSYDHWREIARVAGVQLTMDGRIVSGKGMHARKDRDTLGDYADAVVKVYGEFTVNRMFGGYLDESVSEHKYVMAKYGNIKLRTFVQVNDIYADLGRIKDKPFHLVTPFELVRGIADRRTVRAGKYVEELQKLGSNMVAAFDKFQKGARSYIERDGIAREVFINEAERISTCLYASGPDMFSYFGMEDADLFFNSEWGKRFRTASEGKTGSARATNAVLGIRAAMVTRFRLRHIANLNEQIDTAYGPAEISRIDELQANLEKELDVLASSSDLWGVIAQELRGDTHAFKDLKETRGDVKALKKRNERTWVEDKSRNEFWDNGDASNRYNSLLDVMLDPGIGHDLKMAIALDVVRVQTGRYQRKVIEMDYQLEIGPHSNFTSISTIAYRDDPDTLSDIQSANKSMKRNFDESWNDIRRDVQKARKMHGEEGRLTSYLKTMASNPQAYARIDRGTVADMINAQMRKSSASSEKNAQEIPVEADFGALSIQNGGNTNTIQRMEMKALGYVHEDDLSALDVINALADPGFKLTVYNGEGMYEFSRASLCDGRTDEIAVWDLLEENPFIASLVRPGIITTPKDRAFRNARSSLTQGMSDILNTTPSENLWGCAFAYLIEKPMFRTLVSLFPPISGRRPKSLRETRMETMDFLQLVLLSYAEKQAMGDIVFARDILSNLGITEAYDPRSEDYRENDPSTLEIIGDMDEWGAHELYKQMCVRLKEYVDELADMIKNSPEYDSAEMRMSHEPDSVNLTFDKSSVRLALDVHQTATGERTSTMTGVEGNITSRFGAFSLYTMGANDGFTTIDADMDDSEIVQFVGQMTNVGILTDDNIEYLEELADRRNEPLVVQVPEGYDRRDPSLTYDDDRQLPSIGRFNGLKRKVSTEEGNLKAKKSGDDGKDSILKNGRYGTDVDDNNFRVYEAYEKDGMFGAVMELARILQAADIAENYKDMDLADYACLASVMLRETEGGIVIRPFGMLSAAVEGNMDQDVISNGSAREIVDNATEIVENAGDTLPKDYQGSMARLAASRIRSNVGVGTVQAAKDYSASSEERNFKQLVGMYTQREPVEIPGIGEKEFDRIEGIPSAAKVQAISNTIVHMFGVPRSEIDEYKYVALVDEDGYVVPGDGGAGTLDNIVPGQFSVWVLRKGASQEMVKEVISKCYAYGMTLAFDDVSALGEYADLYGPDMQRAPFSDKMYCLPFFSIRLNGGHISGPIAPPSGPYDPKSIWFDVEDKDNVYGQADAESLVSDEVYRNVSCVAFGEQALEFDDLFYATRLKFGYNVGPVEWCSKSEIADRLLRWKEGDDTQIDLGVPEQNGYYVDGTVTGKFEILLEEYRRAFSFADDSGFLFNEDGSVECRPDRIVGWVKCRPHGNYDYVYAPVVMWPTGSKLSGVPTSFAITAKPTIDTSRDQLNINWERVGDLDGQVVKRHSGDSGANKSYIKFVKGQDLGRLESGHSVSTVTASASFSGRYIGTDKRMCTLRSLAMMMQQPPYGYNMGDMPGAFPDNPEVAERLRTERIGKEEWEQLHKSISRYHVDQEIDALIRGWVDKAVKTPTINPSDLLACTYATEQVDENGETYEVPAYAYPYVDWEFMFNSSLQYQNSVMKFFHAAQPKVCPPSIDEYDESAGYLFRPVSDMSLLGSMGTAYEYGCLQMKWRGRWNNVYINFAYFNDEVSSMRKLGVNGAVQSMEQVNAAAMSGRMLPDREMRLFAMNAASPSIRTRATNDVELDYSRYLGREMG